MLNFYLLEKIIESNMKLAKTPGLALAIVRAHQVVYARGFGVTSVEDSGQPITPHTLFRIGSITKAMTATMLMRLVEIGKLDLDMPLKDIIPWLAFSQPEAAEQVTLRLLLSHTSGLATSHAPFGRRDPQGLEEYIWEQMPKYEFVAPPGMLYAYSNPGIRLAGYAAEIAMGQPYTDLMNTLLFEPLKMTRTTFDPTVAMTYPLAQSHDLQEDGTLTVQHRYADNVSGYPSGGVISNVLDLANFAIMHLYSGNFQQNVILTPESVDTMHTPHAHLYNAKSGSYGLGFQIDQFKGVRRIWHEGSISTFGSKLVMIPEAGVAVIMLFNRAAAFWNLAEQITDYILGNMLNLPTINTPPDTMEPDRSRWAGYTGIYLGRERGLAKIKIHQDQLVLDWNGDLFPLKCLKPDVYIADGISVGFVPGGEYIQVNSSPCKRTKLETHPDLDPNLWESYTGWYRGVDKLNVRLKRHQLRVYSEEFGAEMVAIPLTNTRFACKIGLLEFDPASHTVKVGDGTLLKRV